MSYGDPIRGVKLYSSRDDLLADARAHYGDPSTGDGEPWFCRMEKPRLLAHEQRLLNPPEDFLAAMRASIDQWNVELADTLSSKWHPAVAGSFACVPAAVAGDPYSMRAQSSAWGQGPLTVAVWNACNGGSGSWAQMSAPGLAGLCLAISTVRPVELLMFDGCGWSNSNSGNGKRGAWLIGVRQNMAELSEKEIAGLLDTRTFADFLLPLESSLWHKDGARALQWPWAHPFGADWPMMEANVRKGFGLFEQDVVVPPTYVVGEHLDQQRSWMLNTLRKALGE